MRLRLIERLSGPAIILALLLGLLAKNTPLASLYDAAHHAPVHLGIGPWTSDEPLILWINEGLMFFFFLLVGMELKRELIEGNLSTLRHAILPAVTAVGGVAVPALIYLVTTWGTPEVARGWAIPTATDIVLALAVLTPLGSRVPVALKTFVTALAIFDDIAAVLIIGLFYGKAIAWPKLAFIVIAVGSLWILNRIGVSRIWAYVVLGAILWLVMLSAGIEPTLTGVFVGFAPAMRPNADGSPLKETEASLHPWVALIIVPLFTFFNSGVQIGPEIVHGLASPAAVGIILGLFLGKQIGIMAVAWIVTRTGIALLPPGVTWKQFYGAAVVAGIGFTMSLFVNALAFSDPEIVASSKLAILVASSISATIGFLVLLLTARRIHR